MYAGDEFYDDQVTSGPETEWDRWCDWEYRDEIPEPHPTLETFIHCPRHGQVRTLNAWDGDCTHCLNETLDGPRVNRPQPIRPNL